LTEVEVIQDLSGYSLYVDGGASGWVDVIPFSNATPDVKDRIRIIIIIVRVWVKGAVEVVPKVGDGGVPSAYQPSKPNIDAVKEAMIANLGDAFIYIIACVIGEEGVSGET
jgi:hypothetical protein